MRTPIIRPEQMDALRSSREPSVRQAMVEQLGRAHPTRSRADLTAAVDHARELGPGYGLVLLGSHRRLAELLLVHGLDFPRRVAAAQAILDDRWQTGPDKLTALEGLGAPP